MAIVKYLHDETGVTVTLDSITATAAYQVSELSGDPISREWQAVNHPEIPKPRDGHPAIPFVIVSNIQAKHVDTSTVKVTVTWERKAQSGGGTEPPGSKAVLSLGTSLQQTVTQVDVDGDPITVKYKDADGNIDEQYGEVQVQDPLVTRHYERVVDSAPSNLTRYIGRTNSVPIWGLIERTWLCTGASAVTNDGGLTYVETWDFQASLRVGVDADIAYRDDDGKIPVDADPDGTDMGFKKGVKVYDDADFGDLGLD